MPVKYTINGSVLLGRDFIVDARIGVGIDEEVGGCSDSIARNVVCITWRRSIWHTLKSLFMQPMMGRTQVENERIQNEYPSK